MTEVQNAGEKIENMDSAETTGENVTKETGISITNSHDQDEEDKPNGRGEHEQHKMEEDVEEKDEEVKEANAVVEGFEKSTPSVLAVPVASKEKSKSPVPEEQKHETAEPTEPTDGQPEQQKSAGRGAAKGKGAGRGRPKRAAEKAGSDAETEQDKEDVPTGKEETTDEAQTAPKRGRKRQAPTANEAVSPKVPKADEGVASGSEEGAGDEKKTPLFESALVVEGKRHRQKTDRLDATVLTTPSHTKPAVEVPQGSGTKLGDIPYVDALITKTRPEDLKLLHRLLFNRAGMPHELRKNLRVFNGFDIEKGSEPYTRKWKQTDKWTMKQLKQVCEILGLERGGKKEDLQTSIVDFILKPKDLGRKVPQAKKGPASSGGGKRRTRGRSTRGAGNEPTATSESDEGGHEASDKEEEEKEEEEDEGDVQSDTEPPKAKRGRKAVQKKESAPATSAASTSKRSSRKSAKDNTPTDAELKATIKTLLKGANLEEITMRDMCRKVFAKYPDIDLTNRKDFIKSTVKAVISSSAE